MNNNMVHEYYKVKISDYSFPERLNRVLAIMPGMDLLTLGAVIGESVGASLEHMYMFSKGRTSFVHYSWLNDWADGNAYDMADYTIEDLGDEFVYEYDTGEGYEFKCKVYKRKLTIDDSEFVDEDGYEDNPIYAHYIDGKGAGIFENNHYAMDSYLSGELDGKLTELDEEYGYTLPYNLNLEKLEDFDTAFNAKDEEPIFLSNVDMVIEHLYDENYFPLLEYDDGDYYDDDFDEDEELFDEGLLELEARRVSALEIFENAEVNEVFNKLIQIHSTVEAYQLIHKINTDFIEKIEDFDNYKEFMKERIKAIKKLTRN